MKSRKFKSYEQKLTPVEYQELQSAFDAFNSKLFGGSVPDCFFSYQRKAGSAGSFAPNAWSGRVDELIRDGIRLNPDVFVGSTDQQILQTLVFMMCRAWQWHHGKRSAHGYVNRELADKMKSIGLQPTSTNGVGGKETGSRIFHYVIPKGGFARAYEELVADGWHLNLQSAPREGAKDRKRNKSTFICSDHGENVNGKPSTGVACCQCLELKLAGLGFDAGLIADVIADTKMKDKDAAPVSSYEINPLEQPTEEIKPKRGRPKGSKNKKPKTASAPSYEINPPLVDFKDRQIPTARSEQNLALTKLLANPRWSLSEIAAECGWINSKTGEGAKWKVRRIFETLEKEKRPLVRNNRGKWELTDMGRDVAANATA